MEKNKSLTLRNIIVIAVIVSIISIAVFSLDILLILFAAYVVACAINPLIKSLEKYMTRNLAVALVLSCLILGIFLIIAPLISVCINEMSSLSNSFENILNNYEKYINVKSTNYNIFNYFNLESLKGPLVSGMQKIIESSVMAGKGIANFLTTIFALLIAVFYFAYDEKRLTDKFIEFFPKNQKEKARKILENISQKVGNYVFAQAIAMLFVGVITTIGLLLLHNNHAFILGFLTCILDIIPVVGPTIAVITGLFVSASGGFVYVLLTLAVYIIAQWTQNQFLRPIVFGKLLNMHPLLIIIALLMGARFLGLWGVILSPAIASVICVLVDELYLNKINS